MDNDFDSRLADLKTRHTPPAPRAPKNRGDAQAGYEFIGSLAGGCLLGYGADQMWPIGPWGFITGFILGSFAGFLNLYRRTQKTSLSGADKALQPHEKDDKNSQR